MLVGGFIALGALVDPTGKALSSIGKIGDPLLRGDDFPALTMTNSLATVSPDGTRVCYASMLLTALSFSKIEGNRLDETCRIERPQERKETFRSICSDDAHVLSCIPEKARWLRSRMRRIG